MPHAEQTSLPTFEALQALVLRYPKAHFETPDVAATFVTRSTPQGLVFVPQKADAKAKAEGRDRPVNQRDVTTFLQAMAELESTDPEHARQAGRYGDISHNASYILGLVQAWEDEQHGTFCSPEDRTQPDHLSAQQKADVWSQVQRSMRPRATTRDPNPARIKHGFEVERQNDLAKLRWVATVYWSDNLPANDIEIAFKLQRLRTIEPDTRRMRAWFDHTCQALGARRARRHAGQGRSDFRAGFTTQTALQFFQLLGEQLAALKQDRWATPGHAKVDDGRSNWQWTIDAVKALGYATKEEVARWIDDRKAVYNTSNARLDLGMLSVNYWGRGGHASYNAKPRRSDEGSPYDALYLDDGRYCPYDVAIHGIWALQEHPGDHLLRPQLLQSPADLAIARAEQHAQDSGAFDAHDQTDAREKTMTSVVLRRGQPQFRAALIQAYGGQCAISGCDVVHTLEAAHITRHLGRHTDVVRNGLLLRADLHTLFDLGLLWVDPVSRQVQLHSSLAGSSYAELHGASLRLPMNEADHPDPEALRAHIQQTVRQIQEQ